MAVEAVVSLPSAEEGQGQMMVVVEAEAVVLRSETTLDQRPGWPPEQPVN